MNILAFDAYFTLDGYLPDLEPRIPGGGRNVSIHVETRHDVAVLRLSGAFHGGHETDKLREVLRLSMADHTSKLVIDLGNVTWINSTAIGVLVEAQLDYEKRGARIILANLDKRITDILAITKLARIFEIGPGFSEALLKLGA